MFAEFFTHGIQTAALAARKGSYYTLRPYFSLHGYVLSNMDTLSMSKLKR